MNGIIIKYENGVLTVKSQFDKDLNASEDDLLISEHFISGIKSKYPDASVSLERRSDNYLSLCCGPNDFLRFKYTPRARWLSVAALNLDISPDDPRFAAQKNKGVRFWKANICDISDLDRFDDVVISSYLLNSKVE